MELLLAVLIWIGALSTDQAPYVTQAQANEMFLLNADQIEAEYPDEYGSIIGTYEDEVN